jgi:phosphoglycolate phosphatase
MAFRAVLFDLDGTLLDSSADIAWSGNTLLQKYRYPTHPLAAYNRFIGDGVKALVTRILPEEARTPERIAALIEEYRDLYAGHWNVETYVYRGIPELVAALKRDGFRMAVLSNKPHDFTMQCIKHYLPAEAFDVILGGGGLGPGGERFGNKPNPASALHIAQALGIAPGEFVYLGDTDTDMQTAVNAGMYPVGVLWGMRTREELALNGAKTLIREPGDLLRFLGRGGEV